LSPRVLRQNLSHALKELSHLRRLSSGRQSICTITDVIAAGDAQIVWVTDKIVGLVLGDDLKAIPWWRVDGPTIAEWTPSARARRYRSDIPCRKDMRTSGRKPSAKTDDFLL